MPPMMAVAFPMVLMHAGRIGAPFLGGRGMALVTAAAIVIGPGPVPLKQRNAGRAG